MKKAGRPPTPQKDQVTVIRLQKKHVDMLDEAIRQRLKRDLGAVYTEREEDRDPGTNPTTLEEGIRMKGMTSWRTHVEPINYSKERRELVAMLIEEGLKDDLLYPTKVLPNVPRGPYRDRDLLQISIWAESEGRRLTEEAPQVVQAVLADNRLHKIRRKMPHGFVDWLNAVTYAKLEEDDDEEEETP